MTRYRFSAVGNGDTWDTGLGSTGASIVEFLIGPSTGYGPTAPVCVSDYTSGVVTFSTDGSSASFDLLVIHTL